MTAPRRVMVTGAGGFIGRHLIAALRARGDAVRAVVRRNGRADTLADFTGIDVLHADETGISSGDSFADALRDVDAVCHLAALIPPNFSDSRFAAACVQTNAMLAMTVAEAAIEAGVARFVHFSTAQVYRPSAVPAAEDAPTFPAHRAPFYLGSKLLGEIFIEHLRLHRGLPATTLRVASCYGPAMRGGVVRAFVDHASAGRPVVVRDDRAADFVCVEDVVALAIAALDAAPDAADTFGIFNAGSGRSESPMAVAMAVRDALPEREVRIVDARAFSAGGDGPAFAPVAIDRARRVFGFCPRDIREGIAAMCRSSAV